MFGVIEDKWLINLVCYKWLINLVCSGEDFVRRGPDADHYCAVERTWQGHMGSYGVIVTVIWGHMGSLLQSYGVIVTVMEGVSLVYTVERWVRRGPHIGVNARVILQGSRYS